jgi:hypothetical protein
LRRPTTPAPLAAARVTVPTAPHDVSGPMPRFNPETPVGGWTPGAVFDAALAYSRDEAADLDLPDRRIVALAMRALYVALPSTVKHAQISERLRGVDHYADYIAPLRPSRRAAAPVDTAVEADDEAPF